MAICSDFELRQRQVHLIKAKRELSKYKTIIEKTKSLKTVSSDALETCMSITEGNPNHPMYVYKKEVEGIRNYCNTIVFYLEREYDFMCADLMELELKYK